MNKFTSDKMQNIRYLISEHYGFINYALNEQNWII